MRWFYYNFQDIGTIRYIPLIALFIMSLLCRNSPADTIVILKSVELFLPPLVICWVIPLFFNYVNADTREVYLSYPCSRKKQGILRVIFFVLLFDVFLAAAFFVAIHSWKEYSLYLLIVCVESYFYASLGFLLIVITKNIVISIGMVLGYVGIQVLDTSHVFQIISLGFYDMYYGQMGNVILKLIIVFSIATLFLVIAQRRFDCLKVVS